MPTQIPRATDIGQFVQWDGLTYKGPDGTTVHGREALDEHSDYGVFTPFARSGWAPRTTTTGSSAGRILGWLGSSF